MIRPQPLDFFCQLLSHSEAGLVNRDAINNGIGSGKIDMLKNAGDQARIDGALVGKQLSLGRNINCLSGCYIANNGEALYIQGDTFGSDHVLCSLLRLAHTKNQGANTKGIPERNNAIIGYHGGYRISASTILMELTDCCKNIFRFWYQFSALLELQCKNIQQDRSEERRVGK